MITEMLRWGGLSSPATQFASRLADRAMLALRHRRPILVAGVAASAVALALAYFGIGYLRYSGQAADEQTAAIRAETANAALQQELARLRDQLGVVQGRLATLTDQVMTRQPQHTEAERKPVGEPAPPSKADRLAQLNKALDEAQREAHLTAAQRATLQARLGRVEADLAQEQARRPTSPATGDQWQQRLQQLQAERDKAAAERDALKAQINQLQQQQQRPQPPQKTSAAHPSEPAAAPIPPVASRAIRSPLGEIERVLASAGVDVARLFSQFREPRGVGGPLVRTPLGATTPATLTPEKFAALRAIMKTIPVSAPLRSYEVGSPFGEREDPIDGGASFHTGIDLDAPYLSPVYATAPGVVTFAGYRGAYGKLVEIDHGHGISTRYGHLHRYTVSVGQHVGAHSQIGLLGSTGRATGPHVHYEVLVNGEPQNPTKFFQLGHLLPVAQRR